MAKKKDFLKEYMNATRSFDDLQLARDEVKGKVQEIYKELPFIKKIVSKGITYNIMGCPALEEGALTEFPKIDGFVFPTGSCTITEKNPSQIND